jgi:hypothetical protein|nr:MAG TPA: hypothetical protein [Caudoviricetes sp.]
MIKKTVTYTDFNGTERTDELYFNISKIELMELENGYEGGSYGAHLQKVVDDGNAVAIYNEFVSLINLAYGVKSEDGKHFRKSDEILAGFRDSAAYETFLMGLLSNEDELLAFTKGILPADLQDAADPKNNPNQDKLM